MYCIVFLENFNRQIGNLKDNENTNKLYLKTIKYFVQLQ